MFVRKRAGVINLRAAAAVLVMSVGLFSQTSVFAQDKTTVQDKTIGAIFKGAAKAYIAAADINKFKKDNIDELNAMDAERFEKRYARIFTVITEWPPALKSKYQVTEHMTKAQAIKNIESLDKEKIGVLIDATPDAVIAKRFKKYLDAEQPETQKSSLPEQVNKFWNKILDKFGRPAPNRKAG
ncbi:MAG: hypothetical protein PHO30_07820 [Candidatus Omnitrophica bacterium]|nr:hypothetical protein [Candidatus Omnitrophota bacterium]